MAEIFRRYPDSFTWIGGSALRLLHHSPRASFDVDLVPGGDSPSRELIAAAIAEALREANEVLRSEFRLEKDAEEEVGFLGFRIADGVTPAFSVDIICEAGSTVRSRSALVTTVTGTAAVRVITDSAQLQQKLRALFLRTYPKPGDLFDSWFLLEKGIRLDEQDRLALADEFHGAHMDWNGMEERLSKFHGQTWVHALERTGVRGLNAETAPAMVARVRDYVIEVLL